MFSFALGIGTKDSSGNWLEVFYPDPLINPDEALLAPALKAFGYTGGNQTLAVTPVQVSLLAKVAGIFVEMDITLHNAKITTLGENVEDVFFITDSDNNPIKDPATGQRLQDEIRKRLDAEIAH